MREKARREGGWSEKECTGRTTPRSSSQETCGRTAVLVYSARDGDGAGAGAGGGGGGGIEGGAGTGSSIARVAESARPLARLATPLLARCSVRHGVTVTVTVTHVTRSGWPVRSVPQTRSNTGPRPSGVPLFSENRHVPLYRVGRIYRLAGRSDAKMGLQGGSGYCL